VDVAVEDHDSADEPRACVWRAATAVSLKASLELRLHEAQANRLSHIEFLELILQDELAVRDHRKLERRDCNVLIDHVNAPNEVLDWVKPEIPRANYSSWENVDMQEVEPGHLLVVYDL
jgi:hypothetical protein